MQAVDALISNLQLHVEVTGHHLESQIALDSGENASLNGEESKKTSLSSSKEESKKSMASNGKGAISKISKDEKLIIAVIALHDKYLKIIRECFDKNSACQLALRKGFESFINEVFNTEKSTMNVHI